MSDDVIGLFIFFVATIISAVIWHKKAATVFLFKLISESQYSGTVPMIDIQAYSKWLN